MEKRQLAWEGGTVKEKVESWEEWGGKRTGEREEKKHWGQKNAGGGGQRKGRQKRGECHGAQQWSHAPGTPTLRPALAGAVGVVVAGGPRIFFPGACFGS